MGGDESIVQKTSIACANSEEWGVKKKGTIVVTAPSNNVNVYSITYKLHRIAPNILTTVIGTVALNLLSANVGARVRATQLLGEGCLGQGRVMWQVMSILVRFWRCYVPIVYPPVLI